MQRRLALVALLDEVVDQFARGVIHLDVERFDTAGEVVERHNGRDGHEQAERRGYQSFRNTAGNRADARSLLGGDLLEGVQNADDGSEQSDEGCRRADGGQNTARPLFSLACTMASARSRARCELSIVSLQLPLRRKHGTPAGQRSRPRPDGTSCCDQRS